MKLPPIHNQRSPEQWRIISEHVDFKDKTVMDLGCGYGDILFRCWQAGANGITGVEKDSTIFGYVLQQRNELLLDEEIRQDKIKGEKLQVLISSNLNIWPQSTNGNFDITICFSVLPYLLDPRELLKWMKQHSTISLIECQYSGDGIATPPSIFGARSGENGEPVYGMYPVENDMEMRMLLEQAGWKSIEAIGKTLIKDRNKYRTIWLCQ